MIRDLITAAQADGLSAQRACGVLGLSPRTWQRWQAADLAPSPEPGGAIPLGRAGEWASDEGSAA